MFPGGYTMVTLPILQGGPRLRQLCVPMTLWPSGVAMGRLSVFLFLLLCLHSGMEFHGCLGRFTVFPDKVFITSTEQSDFRKIR